MKNLHKTFLFTIIISVLAVSIGIYAQFNTVSELPKCSYLDPIAIDFLAFIAAVFLIAEGIYRIMEHKNVDFNKQISRAFRIAFGCTIMALHIVQFLHK